MPRQPATWLDSTRLRIEDLGRLLRERRQILGINMSTAAEAAGMSRLTWLRLEKGEPGVALANFVGAADVLGLHLTLNIEGIETSMGVQGTLPLRIELANYPGLRRLAWQVGEHVDALTPREAFGIYRRNIRHLEVSELPESERQLLAGLQLVFDEAIPDV